MERIDADGNTLQPVPVEIKAASFHGFVTEGDRVRIPVGSWRPGKILAPKQFYNETTQSEVKAKSQCYIATAAFDDPDDRYVEVLRNFRDGQLENTAAGRSFIAFYYQVSPPLARIIAKSELARLGTRWLLKCFIKAACPNVCTGQTVDMNTHKNEKPLGRA